MPVVTEANGLGSCGRAAVNKWVERRSKLACRAGAPRFSGVQSPRKRAKLGWADGKGGTVAEAAGTADHRGGHPHWPAAGRRSGRLGIEGLACCHTLAALEALRNIRC